MTPLSKLPQAFPQKVVFIDPGIEVSGVAVWRSAFQKGRWNSTLLAEHTGKAIVRHTGQSDAARILLMAEQILLICRSANPTRVIVEIPPDTVYTGDSQKKQGFDYAVARLTSVFRTYGTAMAAAATLRQLLKIPVETINPIHWELHHTKRKGLKVKDWSREIARQALSMNEIRTIPMQTQEDQNLADAIAMGYQWVTHEMKVPKS